MAHDFYIHRKNEKEKIFAFYGYCNGVMYKAFEHPECDMLISGDGSIHHITKTDAIKGLNQAIRVFNDSHYPDPTRMDEIKDFLKNIVFDKPDTLYTIAFM